MTNEKAPERIYMHPTSAEANVNPWPLEPGEYVEYVRADLLATANKKDTEIAQGIVREWAEHDMNEHYNSDYLRDEFGSEHLEQRIATALATVRKEERSAAYSAVVNNIAAVLDADDVEVFTALIMKAMQSPDLNSETRSALKSEAEIRKEEREAAFKEIRERVAAINPHLTFGTANGSVMKRCILAELDAFAAGETWNEATLTEK